MKPWVRSSTQVVTKPGLKTCACNPSTEEVGSGGSEVCGRPWLCSQPELQTVSLHFFFPVKQNEKKYWDGASCNTVIRGGKTNESTKSQPFSQQSLIYVQKPGTACLSTNDSKTFYSHGVLQYFTEISAAFFQEREFFLELTLKLVFVM